MYIGPWQEYKLARLIQATHEKKEASSRNPVGLPRQSSIDRLHNGGCAESLDRLETSSVASSTRSGLSSKSAPPRLTAQSRLNDMFQDAAHVRRERTPASTAGRPPRPLSSMGVRRGTGARQPAARRAVAPKSGAVPKVSAEAERRARIAHMQRLYGLGASSPREVESPGRIGCMPGASPSFANSAAAQASGPMLPTDIANGTLSPRGLPREQLSKLPLVVASPTSLASVHCEDVMNPVAADPLNVTLNGVDEDLIAWSKMLKPESLSAEVDLACLLRPFDL